MYRCVYIYIYIYKCIDVKRACIMLRTLCRRRNAKTLFSKLFCLSFKIHQRGVQWKQGVVVYTML